MRGRTTVAIVTFLLLLPIAFAADAFEVEVTPVEDSILPGGSALFDFSILNLLDEESDSYILSLQDSDFILFSQAPEDAIPVGKTGVYRVEINPVGSPRAGAKVVKLRVRSKVSGEFEDVFPVLFIEDPDRTPGVYTPSVALSIQSPREVDPREDLIVNVQLRNRNARNYDRNDPITVILESDIFFESYTTSLGPIGEDSERATEKRIDLDANMAPGSHPLVVKVLVGAEVISTQETDFFVTSYTTLDTTEFSDESPWTFRSQTTYKIRNDGNIEDVTELVYPVSIWQQPFVSSNVPYVVDTIDGERSFVFSATLQPQEETEVVVVENYRLLALLVLLIICSVLGYYFLRSPMILAKEATLKGTADEGVNQIKVRLFIKNRSSKELRNLRVIDRISGIAEIVEEKNSLGTVKPTKVVKKRGQGTLIRWDLDQIEPFEERIITYKAAMTLKLVGDITLPNMKVKFDVPSGRERTAHSNEVVISKND